MHATGAMNVMGDICSSGAGVPRKRSSVRFVEDSPVLTPSWKSAAWNRKPANPTGSAGQEVERSPELRGGAHAPAAAAVEGDAEWEGAEAQADREWCAGSLVWVLLQLALNCYFLERSARNASCSSSSLWHATGPKRCWAAKRWFPMCNRVSYKQEESDCYSGS